MSPVPHSKEPRVVAGVLLAGCFSAVLSILWATQSVRIVWEWSDISRLFCAVFLAAVTLTVLPSWFLRRQMKPFWTSLLFQLLVYGGEWWFRSPPPHATYASWRGSIFGAVCLALALLALGWATRYRWPQRIAFGLCAIGVIWASFFVPIPSDLETPASGPDVVLVSIDTLRADHVGPWSDIPRATPVMEWLAADGVLFERTLAPIAVTGPSHASMLTGAGPWRSQMLLNGVPIPPELPMLSEVLSSDGYRTGAFVSAYVLDGELGFQRGFRVYDDDFGLLRGWYRTCPGRIHAMARRFLSPSHIVERRGDATVSRAIAWMEQASEKPMFLWVHLFDPHGPYEPPEPFDTLHYDGDPYSSEHQSMDQVKSVAEYLKPSLEGIRDVDWVRAQYAGEVSFVDEQIGRLVQHFQNKGSFNDTLFIVVGDHGESLGENDVWFNHGGDLDASALEVPFLIHWPAALNPGTRVSQTAGVVDVAPTVLGLLSKDVHQLDGIDWSAHLRGLETLSRKPIQSLCYDRTVNQEERKRGAISKPTHLLARSWTETGWFQLGTHPTRGAIQHGVVDMSVVQGLPTLLGSLGSGVHERSTQRGEDTLQRLRSLGYVE